MTENNDVLYNVERIVVLETKMDATTAALEKVADALYAFKEETQHNVDEIRKYLYQFKGAAWLAASVFAIAEFVTVLKDFGVLNG